MALVPGQRPCQGRMQGDDLRGQRLGDLVRALAKRNDRAVPSAALDLDARAVASELVLLAIVDSDGQPFQLAI